MKDYIRDCLVRIGECFLEAAILDVLEGKGEGGLGATEITNELKIYNPRKNEGGHNNWITEGILYKLKRLEKVEKDGKWRIKRN